MAALLAARVAGCTRIIVVDLKQPRLDLALELAQYGIRVNCVSPGSIATSRAAHRPPRKGAEGRIPLGRHGNSEEIAATVRFLCGPGATFITGQTIHVNGGEKMFF
jgi:3-oxoacyl-[acyl-carrier protein] reductase